jgi:hypothetical protein
MKNLIKSLLLVLVSSCSISQMQAGTSAHNPNEGTSSSAETEKVIRNYFKFPHILMPVAENKTSVNNKVEVLFSTDSTGKVNFALAKTEDKALKKEIEKQFMALQLKQLKSEVVHKVVLNFRTI